MRQDTGYHQMKTAIKRAEAAGEKLRTIASDVAHLVHSLRKQQTGRKADHARNVGTSRRVLPEGRQKST